jgi:high-affinity iron transporter
LNAAAAAARAGHRDVAIAAALSAQATAATLTQRLGSDAGTLTQALWSTSRNAPGLLVALARHADPDVIAAAAGRTGDALTSAQQALGDVEISRATVVTDAAILVFREGLEAVLILAAITASFVGARRALRRPVLLGGLAGIAASLVTWFVAQFVIGELGTGGLRLEAITGILAIVVLLVVTNWFFHRVYWSQWIARFNRRRRQLEGVDRLGFLSGQVAALVLLGLTSVYREGFETVLFLQNLQVSAGTGACVLGAGIGMAGVLAVGGVTFAAQRKLPYRKMLIATGVLIAVVLAVMTGTTIPVMQGLGWLPTTPTPFAVPLWASRWLGIYGTWEGIAAQFGALAIVLGSYIAAREIQVRRPRRRALADQHPARSPVATQPAAPAS